jgi:hypothetical protein
MEYHNPVLKECDGLDIKPDGIWMLPSVVEGILENFE